MVQISQIPKSQYLREAIYHIVSSYLKSQWSTPLSLSSQTGINEAKKLYEKISSKCISSSSSAFFSSCKMEIDLQDSTYLIDFGWTFDIESLSMSLTTNSLLRKNNVPPDTFIGIRTRSATIVMGPKIFKLWKKKSRNVEN